MSENPSRRSVVLVGVDGSPNSVEALRWAADYVHQVGGELHVCIAYQTWLGIGFDYARLSTERVEQETRRILEHTLHEVLGVERSRGIARDVKHGNPTQVLVEASRDADLLVIGDRGSGGYKELLLGSVSENCVRQAHCSVVVVRPRR
jgi:nucleotide-binding universal stress UspA family protein